MPQYRHSSLAGRNVILTGGGRGIGRELTLALVRAGANVAITGRTGAQIDAVAAEANVLRPRAVIALRTDMRDAGACERAVACARDAFGSLQALVNNAGIGMRHISETFITKPPKFWEAPVERWRDIMETNAFGAFYMARAATPHMVRAGFGRIVNISTSPATMIRIGYSPYGPSKAALEAMTRVWAQDLAGSGVTANALLPGGATDTSFIPGAGADRRGADGQLLPVSIMNDALLWLVSDASSGVSGRRLVGKLWDPSLPAGDAAKKAMPAAPALPMIL